ncbi:hypothetical protein V1L54_27285 [Streptomyces sp. TRM 70361]|uniref:hypothetical protein n=1 Tax=Streptomyces sp. TRM 70361 TaxID=3116553 RepID=UPI002E7C4638|nr:hypothetical protein [Streptomyces sp. TRM 70361]MEE1943065.1 hypothetical protein [Streptomyces sp. TRM 70361]
MPRKRPGRVRTKNTNRRAPLLLSTVAPEDFNVRPDEVKSITCPDCRTWRRIMGDKVLKIREHCISDKLAEGEKHTACPGSDQLVVIDIDVRRWQAKQDRLLRDAMPQENRRAARQFYKPLPGPAIPVHQVEAPLTLETARQFYLAHRAGCTACTGSRHCRDGQRLARRFVSALRQDPQRRRARRLLEEITRETERREARQMPRRRARQWGEILPAVQHADGQRETAMENAVSDYHGPAVPLAPLRVTT